VTVHGREEVVVISAEQFRQLKGEATGRALVEAMQALPRRGLKIGARRTVSPVRDVVL
jgi:PHD/YefM family antitoxin component YafN of YafNO toxin-antitoxin module